MGHDLVRILDYMRKDVGMSKAELCRRSGISKAAYEFWVSGKRMPQTDKLDQVGAALGVQLVWAKL